MVFLKHQNTKESLALSLHYFKKPIIRHQSIYVIRKSLPLQSKLSSLHTVITGTKSIFNHFPDWAHQLCGNIVTCLLCKSNIWAETITLCLLQYSLNLAACTEKGKHGGTSVGRLFVLDQRLSEKSPGRARAAMRGRTVYTRGMRGSVGCVVFFFSSLSLFFFFREIKVSDCFKDPFSCLIVPWRTHGIQTAHT